MLPVFGGAIFLGAALVFLVQPMVAKMLLPLFGGSPSVWNTSMVFFQAALLTGYGYAHLSTRLLGLARQPLVHVVLLALPVVTLPIVVPPFATPPPDAPPALWLLLVLLVTAGLPYVAVTTASPVLQRWFAATDHPQARDPYFLYAMSNAGSLLGLLSYPFLIEPHLPLAAQSTLWAALYVAFLGLVLASVVLLRRRRPTAPEAGERSESDRPGMDPRNEEVPIGRRVRWVLLAFAPSSLMLGVTNFLSTDIAAVPLLWAVPLSLYLVTFILAFARAPVALDRAAAVALPFLAVALALSMIEVLPLPIWADILLHLAFFFVAALLAHTRLAADRPAPARLTEYFLLVSLGGVLGGIFNGLLAPLIFDSVLEYPLVIVLALVLRPGVHRGSDRVPRAGLLRVLRSGWALDLLLPLALYLGVLVALVIVSLALDDRATTASRVVLAAAGIAALFFLRRPIRFALGFGAIMAIVYLAGSSAVYSERTFFGVHRVIADQANRHLLVHGTTVHGAQSLDPQRMDEPLTYYHRTGPVGQLFSALRPVRPIEHWAVVGLGSGSMAAYGERGEAITFYEIDPAVAAIAEDPRYFTYLSRSASQIQVVLGDGRLTLRDTASRRYDLLFLDAFSSDAPPAHLMTREAIQLYLSKLRPGGLLVFNVSNRYLDLASALAATARSLGLAGLIQEDDDVEVGRPGDKESSKFVVLAASADALAPLAVNRRWQPIDGRGGPIWSDDFSDILGLVRWTR